MAHFLREWQNWLLSAATLGVAIVVALLARHVVFSLAKRLASKPEPIRIEDVVIVNGEWGWIEEIGTTYVVVRIWDLRCYVREKLIEFLQTRYPQSLPRVRAELPPLPAQAGAA